VISPALAPEYAQIQGTQRLAAAKTLALSFVAIAARKIVRASSALNALLSLFRRDRGTVTFTATNGLSASNRCFLAQPYTVTAAFTHTSLTVAAERSAVILPTAQDCAVSSVKGWLFGPENVASRSSNTGAHRLMVAGAGFLAAAQASYSFRGDWLSVPRLCGSENFGNVCGVSSGE
jgi:hypothetical protein